MGIFFQKFISISFIVLPFFTILWFATKLLRRLGIEKTIHALDKLSDDRKERIIRLYSNIISMHRIALWTTPFGFLLFLAANVLFLVFPELTSVFPDVDIRQLLLLAEILLVIAFVHFLEDSHYRKKILKAIDKSQ